MAEFHPQKTSFVTKALAVLSVLVVLVLGLSLTMTQNKSDWWNQKRVEVRPKVQSEQVIATSYVAYLPLQAQKWAQSPGNVQSVFLIIAAVFLSLFVFQLLLSFLSFRGGYDHELVMDKVYQKRFEELRSTFFKLLRKV